MDCIGDLLNPVVKPLMESIKRERCQIIQQLAAQYLVKLLDLVRNRTPNPINKIVINLCHLLKSDTEFTPRIVSEHSGVLTSCSFYRSEFDYSLIFNN